MAATHFTNLNTEQGLAHLNKHLEHVSYVDGWVPTQSDVALFSQVQNVDAKKHPNVARWHKHISSFSTEERGHFGPADHSLHHHSHDHHHHQEAKKEEAPAAAPKAAAAAPAAAAAEDELDLFGEEDPAVAAERERVIEERRKAHEAKKAASGKVVVAKSSVIFDVKPWDDQTDLAKMEEAVRTIQMEGLHWGAAKLVPIAFGVKKLQIIATIVDDLVSTDDMIDQMQAFEELVQSVDIAAFNKL